MSISDREITPSRRAVLRGAAWTATAVTVVVATPNIAAASGGVPYTPPSGANTGSSRAAKDLKIKTTFDPGSESVTGMTATVKIDVDEISKKTVDAPAGWGPPSISPGRKTATYSYIGTTSPILFEPHINLASNPDSMVNVTVTFSVGAVEIKIPLPKK